ncbi:MAG: two-component system chemotaxis response regulator CheY [Phenylobacterium sp.]|jgi:two-component system chemotaxis response regulator CheY
MSISLLIVDDSEFSRNMIKRALPSNWDVVVDEASSGHEALEYCNSLQFDVIFLDLTMPDVDGLEVLLALSQRNYQSKIFVISADIQPSSKEMSLQRGALDFLPKPVDVDNLAAMLLRHEVL